MTTVFLLSVKSQVIKNKTSISIDEKGVKTTEREVLIRVNSKEENWLSQVEIHHNPKQDLKFNFARITDISGKELKKIKKSELKTRNDLSYQSFYQDDLITSFDLYSSQYPYQISYSYTITEEEYLFIARWHPYVYTNVNTLNATLEVEIPADMEVQINQPKDLDHQKVESNNRLIYSWNKVLPSMLKTELFSLPFSDLLPLVSITPLDFSYGVNGNTATWSSFGSWISKLNQGTDDLTLQESMRIDKVVGEVKDKREIVRKLYYYLQDNTTYVNVAIDVGGLKSYPASYVCDKKYGDCKALTTYMKSMLKSRGIDSYYTIVRAGENEKKLDLEFPSQQFNHVILMIPMETDTLWLENTSNSLPFNYLGTFTQDRYALAVNGEMSQLVKTPKLSLKQVLVSRNYRFELSDAEDTKVNFMTILRGNEFEDFRYYLNEKNEHRQSKALSKHMDMKNIQINNWEIKNFNRDSTSITLQATGNATNLIRNIGSLKVIKPLKIRLPEFEKPINRKLDVIINYPINHSDESEYVLSKIESADIELPKNIQIDNEYGSYSASYNYSNHKITVNEGFMLYPKQIIRDEYEKFYHFIESIIEHKKKSAILLK